MANDDKINIIIQKLKDVGVLKYGNFKLKSGAESNYYCDFRTLLSYPNLLKQIYRFIPDKMFENIDLVCGVFFGGLQLANMVSFERSIPQIFIRDVEKDYGTKKLIEGNFTKGQTVLLIEDVITTGQSVMKKIKILESYGLKIKLLTILKRDETLDNLLNYEINSIIPLNKIINEKTCNVKKIYDLAFKKKSNIILSVDLNKSEDIINLIEETKDNIVGIKIHSDIIDDFNALLLYLKNISNDFIIIEDCKVADISFISLQKVKNYINYADYITYHCLLGSDLPKSLKKVYANLGLLGIIEMSAKECLIDINFMKKTETQLDLMDGCVIQKEGINLFKEKLPITFSPGISIINNTDNYNQTYNNPLKEKVGEFWIIGRSIYLESNKKEISKIYRDLGWCHFINYIL